MMVPVWPERRVIGPAERAELLDRWPADTPERAAERAERERTELTGAHPPIVIPPETSMVPWCRALLGVLLAWLVLLFSALYLGGQIVRAVITGMSAAEYADQHVPALLPSRATPDHHRKEMTMTHALNTPVPHVTHSGEPPATDEQPPSGGEQAPAAETETTAESVIADLFARALSNGPHIIQGRIFEFAARPTTGGQLVVDLRHVSFAADRDPEMRGVALQVSLPPAEQPGDDQVGEQSACSEVSA